MKSKLRNKVIKRTLIIVLVIMILFALSKMYHFVMMNKLLDAIENFKEENRTYLVSTRINDDVILEVKVLLEQNMIMYATKNENGDLNKWKNFQNNEQYSFSIQNKEIYKDDIMILDKNTLSNLPTFIGYVSKENKLSLDKIFEIRHILLTKYNDKICYKIVTKNEISIIDKDTYLPVYSSTKIIDSSNGDLDKIENTYEFKVGEVTDEDVALPDLSEYTIVE